MKILLLGRVNASRDMCFGKLHLLNHVKNMTHATDPELSTRVIAPPFVNIPFIPFARKKECQECAHILLQVGSSAVRFKKVPLTNESKISLRSRSCSPERSNKQTKCVEPKLFIPALDKNTKESYHNTYNFYPFLKVPV